MEVILLLIYSFFVWLIFFKFKWLPWNFVSQVVVVSLPIFAMTALILVLNVVAPSSSDVRAINYVVQVVPRVTGRVIEVPVEANRPVRKGEVLFRIDPVPYQQQLAALEAKLPELSAKVDSADAYQRELGEQLRGARATREALAVRLQLAERRQRQTGELASSGAGSRFDHEQAQTEAASLRSDLVSTTAQMAQVQQKLSAQTRDGELSEVAQAQAGMVQLQAQIVEARWQLEQTVVRAPADGSVINLQLREGSYAASLPLTPVMTFVEREQWILAMFSQNELGNVAPGNEAEIALKVYPNRIIKCRVDSVVWASGTGQLPISGMIPQTGTSPLPPGRIAVRLRPDGRDRDVFIAMGAQGQGAIYTEHGKLIHIVRRVILRVGSKLDWLVLKLH
ncbi:multidrug transporter [Stenotrophomonas rhizophila]|jgi:multidrug resistance efflux pump|uniref:Multidrug resistance efflux pump n=1 Tax=Stenotrophomonas rhizophila TaxID=216778 RepID=A0AAP5AJ27_9GAMM|nr:MULTISPECIES: HlyD family secretion protein [Stenotrophomonas]MDQ1062460.1 multidrug resistance efflux pump [Stenotrophomonas sp. SORGH_AS_0282]MDQ1108448.1 multidrug resistance efflux pump [Stenotrophomonas rhizophila]MDQ1189184.1 multidrug resistance efflux pump [Stenotrophomonas sp. SORGH_AS_0282]PAK91519.1 multidrug transporter [Stenotrophomonas rhizophila]